MKKRYIVAICLGVVVALGAIGTAAYVFYASRLGSSDCTSYEQYDPLMGECYYDCDTDTECEAIAKKVDAELNGYFAGSSTKIDTKKPTDKTPTSTPTPTPSAPVEPSANDAPAKQLTQNDTGSETNGTIYTVTSSQGLTPKPDGVALELWTLFGKVTSREVVKQRVESFEVFNDANNGTAAAVWASQTAGKWHVSINAAFMDERKDLIHTMVHEYGHIATLNDSQVEQVSGSCPRLILPEGCSREGSIVGSFQTKFWTKYGAEGTNWQRTEQDAMALYSQNPDAFVSEYAASNAVEDLAETFATFVLTERPTGMNEKDQKIQFLYESPSMAAERIRIRAALASEIK